MRDYSLVLLTDETLLRNFTTLIARDRTSTAEILAHIAEIDDRRLYAPKGHSSMFSYCVEGLHFSEDAAAKRIHAARACRRHPLLFEALSNGRLHLSGICLLAPHLNEENVAEWIRRATHRRKSEIEEMVGARWSRASDRPATIRALPPTLPSQRAPGHVASSSQEPILAESAVPDVTKSSPAALALENDSGTEKSVHSGRDEATEHAPGHVEEASPPAAAPMLAPIERFRLQVTIGKETWEKLARLQALLSHTVPAGDVAQVLDRAFDALLTQVEKQKLGSPRRTGAPNPRDRARRRSRYVPAHVRKAVWKRDQGQCTFVGSSGHRCGSRHFLQLDHIQPFSRGGESTVEGLRLRCGVHNRYEAERVFGRGYMDAKRRSAQRKLQGVSDPRAQCSLERAQGDPERVRAPEHEA